MFLFFLLFIHFPNPLHPGQGQSDVLEPIPAVMEQEVEYTEADRQSITGPRETRNPFPLTVSVVTNLPDMDVFGQRKKSEAHGEVHGETHPNSTPEGPTWDSNYEPLTLKQQCYVHCVALLQVFESIASFFDCPTE